jgi:hypothetical protein
MSFKSYKIDALVCEVCTAVGKALEDQSSVVFKRLEGNSSSYYTLLTEASKSLS